MYYFGKSEEYMDLSRIYLAVGTELAFWSSKKREGKKDIIT